jgi:hypothetical protein
MVQRWLAAPTVSGTPVSSSLDPTAVDEVLSEIPIKFMVWREWSPLEHGKKKTLREQFDIFIKMGFSKNELGVVYYSDKTKQVQPWVG